MKKPSLWLFAFFLTTAIISLVWLTRPPERRLLKRAIRVADVGIQNAYTRCWLPNGDVLLFSLVHNSWVLSRLEKTTGVETPLPALTALYNRFGAGEGGISSPDGSRLLWRGGNDKVYESALDGSGFTRWTLQSQCTDRIFWLPDSRRWCEIAYVARNSRRYLFIHSMDRPNDTPVSVPQPLVLTDLWDGISVTPQQTLLIAARHPHLETNPVEIISEYRIEPALVLLHQYHVILPKGAEVGNVAFNPQGKRIGLNVLFPKRSKQPHLWARFLRMIHAQDTLPACDTLWVSDLDGSRTHEVGYMVPTDLQSDFSAFDWMPDGQHLWFVSGWYNKTGDEWNTELYTVPAD